MTIWVALLQVAEVFNAFRPDVLSSQLVLLGIFISSAMALLGCGVLGTTGEVELPPEAGGGDWQRSAVEGDIVLVAGDVIALSFPGTPELDQPQRIRPDGKVTLPLVNDVQAAGERISDLEAKLSVLYADHLKDSRLNVVLQQTANAVYVSGEVPKPGKIPLERPMSVIEAIMESGGVTAYADLRNVILLRREGGGQKRYRLDLRPAFNEETSKVIYLKPFDVIHVNQRKF